MSKRKENWEKKAPPPSVELPKPKSKPLARPLVKTPPPDLDRITDADLERVLLAIAMFDPRRLYNEDGTPILLTELDDVTALAISGLDVDENWDWENGKRVNAGITKKFKLSDRQRAIETLLQMRGKLNHSVKVTGVDELVQRLTAGRKRTEKK